MGDCSSQRPLVGVSACLAGYKVRYDGRDKRHALLMDMLTESLELMPVCPEAAIGMGIPRPPIQLVQFRDHIIARGRDDRSLLPGPALMHLGHSWATVHANSLCGFICQSRSPSCGFGSTPVYNDSGEEIELGNGLFIEQLRQVIPELPILEDRDLDDIQKTEEFLTRCQKRYEHTRSCS